MKARDVLELDEFDEIITGYALPVSGPGWGNSPFWVIVRNGQTGIIRDLCLQPEQQSPELLHWYGVLAAIHGRIVEILNK